MAGRHSRRQYRSWRVALRAAAVLTVAGPTQAAERQIRDVVYDYAVTSYCGTLTPEVDAGFRAELEHITARSGLSDESAKDQRIAGWVEADQEWSNRGLGGYRAWCESEGVEAARRFQAYPRHGTQGQNTRP